ncbi:MAG: hypothetical protein P1S60_10715, partial [Anaerolineae bacterium]|nr:hypothetical protein [Anaerolineae bacterium]
MSDKLYFNGVNGTTGGYGLPPMQVSALADHILQDRQQISRRLHDIEEELNSKYANDNKIISVVDLLIRMVLSLTEKNIHEDLVLDALATKLMHILLDKNDVLPGDIQEFSSLFKQKPVEMMAIIIRELGRGEQGSRELSRLLTTEERDSSIVMMNVLRQQFAHAVDSLQLELLAIEDDQVLHQDGTIRRSWVERFIHRLSQLPVATMRIITGQDGTYLAMRQLATILLQQRDNLCNQPYYIDALTQNLDASASRRPVYWHQFISIFQNALMDWLRNHVVLHWATLSRALDEWLEYVATNLAGDMGVVPWIDPRDLGKTGWGLVFPALMPADKVSAIKHAMRPLLVLREQQAGALFRIYEGKDGYRPGDSAGAFLMRGPSRAARPEDPVDPATSGVPYYLLLVGDPELIPFKFQYQLDVQYAVGRLDFGDDIQAYVNYAENVVSAEQRSAIVTPKA